METSFLQGSGIEALPQFITSLAIGLLIGLERERNPSAKAGLRTFALVALFGTLTAMLSSKSDSSWLMVAGLCIVGVMIIAAYFNSPAEEQDPGTTTVAALLLCYALGALVWYDYSRLAIMLAITTTTLLYFKPELRGMTQRLTRRDLVSILQFLVLTFIVLTSPMRSSLMGRLAKLILVGRRCQTARCRWSWPSRRIWHRRREHHDAAGEPRLQRIRQRA